MRFANALCLGDPRWPAAGGRHRRERATPLVGATDEETGNKEHTYPVLFSKWASTLAGAYDDLPRPPESTAMDYEGELAVVIGPPTRRVSPQDAAHVAGYEFTALVPGDLILTGTPSGVGFRRDPQLLLGDGDIVITEIEGIGRLENRVVAER